MLSPKHLSVICLVAATVAGAPAPPKESKVALLTVKDIERIAKARVKALPKRVPQKDREMLLKLIKRQLRQERYQQTGNLLKGKIRCRSVARAGQISQELDVCQMYLHADDTISRGYAGQVVGMALALTDDSAWQQAAAPDGRPLSIVFQVYVKPMFAGAPRPLADGETLRDRGGADGKGDKYCIVFRTDSPCYVYIVQLDVTGRFYPLYPSQRFGTGFAFGKQAAPGVVHTVPPQKQGQPAYFHLDQNRGDESLYFLVSRKRRPDIEQRFRYFEQASWTLPSKASRGLTRAGRPSLRRGPKGVTVDRLVAPAPGAQPQGIPAGLAGAKLYRPTHGDMLITRWFVHR